MIGRFGLDVGQDNVAKLDQQGDGLVISGRLSYDGGGEVEVLRAQLAGLADNPFESFYPVVYDAAPSVTGYYVVTDVSVSLGPGSLVIGHYDYTVTLRRVANYQAPLLESSILGNVRPNGNGVTTSTPWQAVPVIASGYALPNVTTREVRRSVDGDLRVYSSGTNTLNAFYNGFSTYQTPPDHFYDGSPRVAVGAVDTLSSTLFGYVGGGQNYVVPAGVTRLRVECRGAQGGGYAGGKGGRVAGDIDVTPGETLAVRVGGQPGGLAGGFNGGGNGGASVPGGMLAYGGGGATDVRRGVGGLSDRVMVGAGGGGTAGGYAYTGGAGGWPNGATAAGIGNGGHGATQTAPGGGGIAPASTGYQLQQNGVPGASGQGGAGGAVASVYYPPGGGGGGGWFGGGGGGNNTQSGKLAGSGGGGSGYTGAAGNVTSKAGSQSGHGAVILTPVPTGIPDIDRYTVIGDQAPNQPYGWQIGNGLISITPAYDAARASFDVVCWTGDRWSAPTRWTVQDTTAKSDAALTLSGFSVLDNSSEQAVIRLSYEYGTAAADQLVVTITLRRGALLADVQLDSAVAKNWSLRTAAATTATAIGTGSAGGIYLTVDADGNNPMLICAAGPFGTALTGNPGVWPTGPLTSVTYGLGAKIVGTAVTTTTIQSQWYATQTIALRPVLR